MAEYKYSRTGDEVKAAIESVINKNIYNVASQLQDGLMSAEDKKNLDNLKNSLSTWESISTLYEELNFLTEEDVTNVWNSVVSDSETESYYGEAVMVGEWESINA